MQSASDGNIHESQSDNLRSGIWYIGPQAKYNSGYDQLGYQDPLAPTWKYNPNS